MFVQYVRDPSERRKKLVFTVVFAALAIGLGIIVGLTTEPSPTGYPRQQSADQLHAVAGVIYPIQSISEPDEAGVITLVLDGYDADGLGSYFLEQRSTHEIEEVDEPVLPPGTTRLSALEFYRRRVILINPKGYD